MPPGRGSGHLRLMAGLSSWLSERGLDGSALSLQVVDGFVLDRRAVGHREARSARSLRPLLEYLREVGAAPLPGQQRVAGPVEVMLADYGCWPPARPGNRRRAA
jgi:integrase/recombinase XerD